jgi:hypothetical protein
LFFQSKDFVILAAENNLDAFMTKIQASIKQGEIDEALTATRLLTQSNPL